MIDRLFAVPQLTKGAIKTIEQAELRAVGSTSFGAWLLQNGWRHSELSPLQRQVLHAAYLRAN
ncbi:hypothetical protein [Schlesneria sp. T3-172]|uniref:hypothetical protein n=1 Tax=Schlesneria sphaerica TaxID=3373610 RepID=UPI0037C56350